MFGMPAPSAYDWNFRLLQVPVRVSPYFWLTCVFLLGIGSDVDAKTAILWIGSVFISILVHEFGHALTARAFGYRPQVFLYGMGGLCASEGERQTFGQRMAVLFMGPGIQFILLGLLILASGSLLGLTFGSNVQLGRLLLGLPPGGDPADAAKLVQAQMSRDSTLWELYWNLFQINLLWPLLNLLPIWPLDGGQMAGEVLNKANPRDGKRWGHIVSMLTAGLIVAWTLAQSKGNIGGSLFRIIFFGYFAYINFQLVQLYHRQQVRTGPDDDSDWWTGR